MALNHFSHDHPLMLVNEVQKEDGEEEVGCYGCQKAILSSAYCCNDCNYFLHEKCAKLPKEITHPKHLEHPLTLLSHPPYWSSNCTCDVCRIENWKWFTYHRSLCEFDVHVQCVLEKRVFEHKGHLHPLTFMYKEALFHCDACDTEDKDSSYFCNTCGFWIHKSCALSPSTIEHNTHDHPLVLNYFLPYNHRSFDYDCDICKQMVNVNNWVYICDRCRYFVHVKCATSKTMIRGAINETRAEDELESSIIKFPIVDESVKLLGELLKEANLGNTDRTIMLTYFSHDHPLLLFDNENEMKDDEIICKACLLPIISTPFYGCDQCNFFLHGSCAEVPQELRHPLHPEHHQFNLKMSFTFTSHDKFTCSFCFRNLNGFRYKCDSCCFTLCVVCAYLPFKIRHEAHEHPLRIQRQQDMLLCNACNRSIVGNFIYRCDICDYCLGLECVTLPRKARHAWDRHLITLRYPPYSDHPDDFYCELCEEQIHPKFWLYHCRDCDHPFHTQCLCPIIGNLTITFGKTIEIDIHPHKLTILRKLENTPAFTCKRCDCTFEIANYWFLECAPCQFQVCVRCAWPYL